MRRSLAICLMLAAAPASATVYEVGSGKTYATIGAVPWSSLVAGDNVKIYPGTYHERIEILSLVGTAGSPIVIEGIPDVGGTLPVISGDDATTGTNFGTPRHSWPFGPSFGLVYFGAKSGGAAVRPAYIVLKNLRLTKWLYGGTSYDSAGTSYTTPSFASAIYMQGSEHITIQGLEVVDNTQGIFINTNADHLTDEIVSSDILLTQNKVWGNGRVGVNGVHNVYSEAAGITMEYNWFGPPRNGAPAVNVKDRSSGLVFRYNWVHNGAYLLDLVPCEASCNMVIESRQTEYSQAYVYGNVLVNSYQDPNGGAVLSFAPVHWQRQQNTPAVGVAATLYFYHNTYVNYVDQSYSKLRLFNTSYESLGLVRADNNLFLMYPYTQGANPCPMYLRYDEENLGNSRMEFGKNLISPGWGTTFLTGDQRNMTGLENLSTVVAQSGLLADASLAVQNYAVPVGSEARDTSGALPAIISSGNVHGVDLTPAYRYVKVASSDLRTMNGSTWDIGAFEYDGATPPTITSTDPLPQGSTGTAYSQCLTSTGGAAPLTWDLTVPAQMCSGLTLSSAGCITGTPDTVQTCSFTARVTDNNSATDTQALSIIVAAPPPALSITITPGSGDAVVWFGAAGLAYSMSCQVTLRSGGTSIGQQTVATGSSRRFVTFTGLGAGVSYTASAACGGGVESGTGSFTTRPIPETAGAYTLRLKPTAGTLARMTALDAGLTTAKAAVYWKAPGEGAYTATKAVCPSGCTITKSSLASGIHSYYITWESNSTDIASSAARPASVAIP